MDKSGFMDLIVETVSDGTFYNAQVGQEVLGISRIYGSKNDGEILYKDLSDYCPGTS